MILWIKTGNEAKVPRGTDKERTYHKGVGQSLTSLQDPHELLHRTGKLLELVEFAAGIRKIAGFSH
jgi:hypothetical protein